ncbi:MAG TPA: GyrI-like domain-containing protein [Rhizobiaceae bacterium]|nr:GyrI-like domain-containing protein [Rhizobiaceae bacterium]
MLDVTKTGMRGIGLSIPQVISRDEEHCLVIPVSGPMASMPQFAPPKFAELHAFMQRMAVLPSGPGFFRYRRFDEQGNVELEVGSPVESATSGGDGVKPSTLPAGRYASATYTGPYDRLYDGFLMLEGWMRGRGLEPAGEPGEPACQLEIYRVSPMDESDPAKLVTELLVKLAGTSEEEFQ